MLFVLLLFLVITPAFAQLSDRTGLVNRLDVKTGGHSFEVQTVSNFDVSNYTFDEEQKRLTLYVTSGLENNLGEIYIPKTLLSGNFTFYINGQQYHPVVKINEQISFITLNFTGSGDSKIEIIGTDYLHGVNQTSVDEPPVEIDNGGGCLIATATYGSELAPQVQQLRELRDNQLLKTESGKLFMISFNDVYYSFSPAIADYERENPVFKQIVKIVITPMLSTLSILSLSDDSEFMMLGLGVSVILLNIGMYLVAPVIVIVKIAKKF
ncbi:MAG: peptidylprolyl isomerase [Nitrosopumilales archaeon CG15_BIG_FIL_POST_REV_8_21_14_020_33_23]|nr:MAG: peptidylprolyl isomerase [Nitrosopumilales archaeon CG11_big_fil_rev_8_21_14_0_20_33_24]PIW34397.1 MAG: peptidylprolyl isomerase [Nitrosopumilales archaeon CG15_BIG_FIL_POST_REV_8_21_14_020_33_23]